MKRSLTLLLALLMCLSLLPMGALAERESNPEKSAAEETPAEEDAEGPILDGASSGSCGDNVSWVLDNNGTLTISGSGDMSDYLANAPWFNSAKLIKSVVIKNGVTSIGDWAFNGCTRLTSVTIPNSVKSIGIFVFCSCSSLTSVKLPKGLTYIGDYAFLKCSSLTSVNIPKSVTSIGSYAFQYCSSLTSVKIPDGMTSIGDWVFMSCSNLTSVTISNRVTFIGDYAFRNSGLQHVYYAGSKSKWINIGGDYAAVPSTAVIHFNSVKQVSLASAKITFPQKSYTYNGERQEPLPTVKLDGLTLIKDTEYTVKYSNNKAVGTATVTVTGKDDYTGKATATFKITKAANKITASSKYANYSTKSQKINLGASATGGTLTYKSSDDSVTVTKKGIVKIPAKFTGTVTITISANGNDNYKAAKNKSVKVIVLGTPTISSVTSGKANKMTAKWDKVSGASGYELQYVKTKKFAADSDTVTLKKTTKTISRLTAGKTYRVRVRAYKTLKSGETVYSAWSDVGTVKVQ